MADDPEANASEDLDPVAEKLGYELGMAAPGGQESPWQFWVGTQLIDIGMWVFRELEGIALEDGRPVFPDMALYVKDPLATEVSAKFIAAAYPTLASRMCEIGEVMWETWAIDEWRHLDKALHEEMFEMLVRAWELPDDQVTYLTEFAANGFMSDDEFVRGHMAYSRFQASMVWQAYLLPSGESAQDNPALKASLAGGQAASTTGAVFATCHGGLCEYLRGVKYYTEDVDYRTPP